MKARKRNSFIITDIVDTSNDNLKSNDVKKEKSKSKKRLKKSVAISERDNNSSTDHRVDTNDEMTVSDQKDVKHKDMSTKNSFKTNRFRDKCLKNRMERGMILLSPKAEKKIYNMKKGLRKKGFEESEIKELVRKRRREEEIQYMKICSKKCFKCRQIGHKLAECPLNGNDCEEGVDVCYRCGSSEHKLSECHQKSNVLHVLRGRSVVGTDRSVMCASDRFSAENIPDDEELEKELTLPTVGANHSIDAEVMDTKPMIVKTGTIKRINFVLSVYNLYISQNKHITRDCPRNTRGVYPKGGSCKACHSVNHLIKDCPQNQKDEELEKELTLPTVGANHSIDAEVMDTKPMIVKTETIKRITTAFVRSWGRTDKPVANCVHYYNSRRQRGHNRHNRLAFDCRLNNRNNRWDESRLPFVSRCQTLCSEGYTDSAILPVISVSLIGWDLLFRYRYIAKSPANNRMTDMTTVNSTGITSLSSLPLLLSKCSTAIWTGE
ncbi:unnamed protein product [Oppiella nova]|uniref:CCHC-type domain-containing protein n=1 Tax=Oppiella nova TaxID=334625 RepID=A0A7R9QA17_9ACAR|nr:unnamed protein product [Oppiella nova]CAG2161661.1 unnamed protein product [Oppiella nova]